MGAIGIGTLRERSLHAEIKRRLGRPGDEIEARVDGYVVDIRRGERIIEIQTANFSSLRRKLADLADRHPVTLVHPIAARRTITTVSRGGEVISRRRSPLRGAAAHLFLELVSIPQAVLTPGFSLQILLVEEEQILRADSRGSRRRRRRSLIDRRLVEILETVMYESPGDFRSFIPESLRQPFTSRELAQAIGQPLYLAQKMTYCLRIMNVIEAVAKSRNAILYIRRHSDEMRKGSVPAVA